MSHIWRLTYFVSLSLSVVPCIHIHACALDRMISIQAFYNSYQFSCLGPFFSSCYDNALFSCISFLHLFSPMYTPLCQFHSSAFSRPTLKHFHFLSPFHSNIFSLLAIGWRIHSTNMPLLSILAHLFLHLLL